MIEEKYIKHNDKKYYYQIGKSNVIELLQRNMDKIYPENFEMMEDNLIFKFVQFDMFAPPEVAKEIIKYGGISDTVYKRVITVKKGDQKFKLITDTWGV